MNWLIFSLLVSLGLNGCNLCEKLSYEGNPDCQGDPAALETPCADVLNGVWEADTWSDIYYTYDPTAGAPYCSVTDVYMDFRLGGNGSDGHNLGIFNIGGDVESYIGTTLYDTETLRDRMTQDFYYAVASIEADGDVTIEIYDEPVGPTGGSATTRSILEGAIDPANPNVLSIETFSADPTWVSSSDAAGCLNFQFSNIQFYRSNPEATADGRTYWNLAADPEEDEAFEECPEPETGDTGDTGDTGGATEGGELPPMPPLPESAPPNGHFPTATYWTLAGLWSAASNVEPGVWAPPVHVVWDQLTKVQGGPPPIALLLGAGYPLEDWELVRHEGHRRIGELAIHPEFRFAVDGVVSRFANQEITAGQAEWEAYWIIRGVPMPPMPPPPPQGQ